MLSRFRGEFNGLEKSIGYKFRNKALLREALTHRSYRYEHEGIEEDNQRLEFLGDAALGLVSAEHIFKEHTQCLEGDMTILRSRITNGKYLASIAVSAGVGLFLRVGKGEELSGGRERESNLADAFEAILGAAFLDGGLKAVEKIFAKLFSVCLGATELRKALDDNPKGKLQEICQRKWHANPLYRIVKREGPAHEAVFMVEAVMPDGSKARGIGRTKRIAEMEAAAKLIARAMLAANQK